MILSKPDIIKALDDQHLVIDPRPAKVDQVSVNLHIGRRFMTFKPLPKHFPAIRVRPSLFQDHNTLWTNEERDYYRLEPGAFVLAQTSERIEMPNDLMGFVEGRSSWARAGISIHLAAPKIDPGFNGTITLEMTNHSNAPVELVALEDDPAQLIFMRLTNPLKDTEVYGTEPGDVFQNQDAPLPR